MRVLIVGGKLQGVEASYLSHKCGFETVLVDKDYPVPAINLCDRFVQMDIFNRNKLSSLLNEIDIVIPALENKDVLNELSSACEEADVDIAFSNNAYSISSSKEKSKSLFEKLNLPIPKSWPGCSFPVILKPSFGSGSEGVRIFHNDKELLEYFTGNLCGNFSGHYFCSIPENGMIIEEYLEGRQYSLEVIGFNGEYKCLQVTELEMDDIFDCKRVIAPTELLPCAVAELENFTLSIAQAIDLNGIMDVEAVYYNGKFKVLEIDARLPSQTPIAVFWSTGFNMIENLVRVFQGKAIKKAAPASRTVVLEHFKVNCGSLEICGEHIMAEAADLQIQCGFFGADEALTNYRPDKNVWTATIIVTGENRSESMSKRAEVIERIRKQLRITHYQDSSPILMDLMAATGIHANG